jgi:CheY-like chemotaxis protein
MRILVAEDNQINQMVVTKMLDRLAYSADFVSNGREAVAAAGRRSYDVILMDVMMPLMGGIEAAAAIRSAESTKHRAYIIALTANARDEDRQRCLDAGMDDFISKPFVLETIRAKLSALASTVAGQ